MSEHVPETVVTNESIARNVARVGAVEMVGILAVAELCSGNYAAAAIVGAGALWIGYKLKPQSAD